MRRAARLATVAALLLFAPLAGAEQTPAQALEDAIVAEWQQQLARANPDFTTTRDMPDKRPFYEAQVDALLKTQELKEYRAAESQAMGFYVAQGRATAESSAVLARSTTAASTNPRSAGLIERSGIVDLIALAVQGTNLLSADDRAVTLDLSATALLCRSCRDQSAPAAFRYRAGGVLNRIGGSFTFGAEIPEKEITGFSGFPDRDKLFDVIVWDGKVRLLGDRDPRSAHWDPLVLGELGGLTLLSSRLVGDPRMPEADFAALRDVLVARLKARTAAVARTIRRSLQVSVKFSGQNLTKVAGMNKYTGVLMADKGLGGFDGSLNVSYSAVQDVKIQPGLPVTLKQWKAALSFVGPIWKGVFVSDRSAELALTGAGVFPVDGAEVLVSRKKTYKADVALKVPISDSLELPFSVTYTNDPNELAKKNYVTGRIGVSYDFGALKRLAAGK